MGTSSIEEEERSGSDKPPVTDLLDSSPAYTTDLGATYQGDSRELLKELPDNSIDLIVTSPPFALQHEKEYGNKDQESYNDWFMEFVPEVERVLQPHGSFIVEIGGAFEQGLPKRSIYQFKLLTRIVEEEDLEFAQDWYWYNKSKLPSPIEWVNVRKLRGVDAVTQIWWLASEINKEPAYTADLKDKVEAIRSLRSELSDTLDDDELYIVVKAILSGTVELPEPDYEDTEQATLSSLSDDEKSEEATEQLTIGWVKSLLKATQSLDEEAWVAEYDLSSEDVRDILEFEDSNDDKYFDDETIDILVEKLSPYRAISIFDLMLRTDKAPQVYKNKALRAVEDGEEVIPPYPKPEVDNQRNPHVLKGYSEDQEELIETGEYNEGERSSGHNIGDSSFANDNEGAIPKNFIDASNTASNTHYQRMCRKFGFDRHPARFPEAIPKKFVNLLTPDPPYDDWERGDIGSPGKLDRPIVLDIFGGSNWTGKVAEDAGRYWLSFERDKEYVHTSEMRFLDEEEIKERLADEDDPLHQLRQEEKDEEED